jgi:uncharacterized membrane protein
MQSVNNNSADFEEEIKKTALWVAIASVLQISESLIPHPIPGVRFGFANMVTLVIMANYSFSVALKVAILRTLVSSFIIGTFLSPAFILSFSGALISTLAMGLLYRFSVKNTRFYFSLIGISVLGAFTHNLTQLTIAYLLLIRHTGIFVLLPWLSIGAVVMGLIAGTIAVRITLRLRRPEKERLYIESCPETEPSFHVNSYFPGKSFIHRLRPETKISSVILLALLMFFIETLWCYLLMVIGIIMMVLASKVSLTRVFLNLKRLFFLILTSFLLPVFFNSGGEIILRFGPVVIIEEALLSGALLSLRIVILVMIATLLAQTTSIHEMITGLKRILLPLKIFGIDSDKMGKIIALSWQWLPDLWKEIRSMMKFLLTKKEKRLGNTVTALTDFLVFLFQKKHP